MIKDKDHDFFPDAKNFNVDMYDCSILITMKNEKPKLTKVAFPEGLACWDHEGVTYTRRSVLVDGLHSHIWASSEYDSRMVLIYMLAGTCTNDTFVVQNK